MTNIYQPHVYLDGVKLPATADLEGITPLAHLDIRWGADTWWDNIEPSELTLTLLDPHGTLLRLAEQEGRPIKITRDDPTTGPDSVTVFEGHISALKLSRDTVTTRHGTRLDVWVANITALDPLAIPAKDRAHGPTYPGRYRFSETFHWGPQTGLERLTELENRIPVPLLFPTTGPGWWISRPGGPATTPTFAPYETSQNVSVLTVLRNSLRTANGFLVRPYYDPSRGGIDALHPLIVSAAPEIDIQRTAVPAGGLRVGTGSQYHTRLDGGLLVGEVSASLEGTESVSRITANRRAITATRNEDNQIEYSLSEQLAEHTVSPTGSVQNTFEFVSDLLDVVDPWTFQGETLQFATNIFGRHRLAPFTWKQQIGELSPPLASRFLNPAPHHQVGAIHYQYFIGNNLRNSIPHTATLAIGGGVLSYDSEGWSAECWPLPSALNLAEPTLGELTSDGTLGAFLDDSLVADMTQITKG